MRKEQQTNKKTAKELIIVHPLDMSSDLTLEKMLGSRRDGRTGNVIRPIEVRWGELSQADGSTWFTQGNTAVLATVVGPTAARAHQEDYKKCVVEALINRAQPSAPSCGGASRAVADQCRIKLLQADTELQAELSKVLASVVMAERYPRCTITISLNILKDDGSLFAACANAAMCALLNSGIYCRATICGVSLTKWKRTNAATAAAENVIWLDTTKDEESEIRRESRLFSSEESPCGVAAQNDATPILAIDASFIVSHPPLDGTNSIAASTISTSVVSSAKPNGRSVIGSSTGLDSDDTAAAAAPSAPACTLQDVQQLMKVAERCCLSAQGGVIEFIRGVMNPNNLVAASSTENDSANAGAEPSA